MSSTLRPVFAYIIAILGMSVFSNAIAASFAQAPMQIPFFAPWDIRSENNAIVQSFEVKEHRIYRFEMMFSPLVKTFGPKELDELEIFTGKRPAGEIFRDPDRTDSTPSHLPGSGVPISVHIKIDKQDPAQGDVTLVDKVILTQGIEGSGRINRDALVGGPDALSPLAVGGLSRYIWSTALPRGIYRLQIQAVRETALPPNVITVLAVTTLMNMRALAD